MLPDRVSNPGPLTYESGALPIALHGPAILDDMAQEERVSKKGLRLELARTKNKDEKCGQNMRKMKKKKKN